jgi:serine/threonine-protein kinase RsbT
MMDVLNKDEILIQKEFDVVACKNRVKEFAVLIGMSIIDQTKILTAASEMVRNMLRYAGGGKVIVEIVNKKNIPGVKLTFIDEGPGIKDIKQAMENGFSTGKSLGLGLPGTKRLVNEFDIKSELGKGTTITIIRWKNA